MTRPQAHNPSRPPPRRLEMRVDTLDWPVMVLANLDADFEVEGPDELGELVRRTGSRFMRALA